MITVSRASLRLLSIAIGLLFTATVYYTMHYNPRWDWTARGIGQLPRDIVHGFMAQAYAEGQGGAAHRTWFAPNAADYAADASDQQDGAPIGDEIRQIVAQGMTVAVIHRIAPARGGAGQDVIDVFEIKEGRIARRDRYPTTFAH